MKNLSWQAAVVIGIFVAGGIACLALGQVDSGAGLLGVALGLVPPLSLVKAPGAK